MINIVLFLNFIFLMPNVSNVFFLFFLIFCHWLPLILIDIFSCGHFSGHSGQVRSHWDHIDNRSAPHSYDWLLQKQGLLDEGFNQLFSLFLFTNIWQTLLLYELDQYIAHFWNRNAWVISKTNRYSKTVYAINNFYFSIIICIIKFALITWQKKFKGKFEQNIFWLN